MIRPPPSRRAALRQLAGAALLLPAACTNILHPAPLPRLYALRAVTPDTDGLPAKPWRLVVPVPEAPRGIATARIALLRGPYALDYFAGAAWTDEAPAMLQSLLIESFQNTGKLAAIDRETIDWPADLTLDIALFDFEARYKTSAGPPVILVRLVARLVRNDTRRLAASIDIAERRAASADSLASIIPAFDAALGAAMSRLILWTLATDTLS